MQRVLCSLLKAVREMKKEKVLPVCVWDADSAEKLKEFIDAAIEECLKHLPKVIAVTIMLKPS